MENDSPVKSIPKLRNHYVNLTSEKWGRNFNLFPSWKQKSSDTRLSRQIKQYRLEVNGRSYRAGLKRRDIGVRVIPHPPPHVGIAGEVQVLHDDGSLHPCGGSEARLPLPDLHVRLLRSSHYELLQHHLLVPHHFHRGFPHKKVHNRVGELRRRRGEWCGRRREGSHGL